MVVAACFCGTCGHLRNSGAVQVVMQALQSTAQPIQPSRCVQVTTSAERYKGYRKVLQGLITSEQEHQQQQQQEASTSNKHCATSQLAAGLLHQDDGRLPLIIECVSF
eukprot:1152617-Pelagomonas_calceolata.AAC.4